MVTMEISRQIEVDQTTLILIGKATPLENTTLLQDIVLNDLLPLLIIGSIFLLLLP